MEAFKIGVVVGSARRESYTGQVARALCAMLPPELAPRMIEIAHLPLFNQDYDDDGTTPSQWAAFRDQVRDMDGYLFLTPEYNRSFPPLLKNALDIASRPYGQNRWGGKPGALISVSPGKLGGFGASMHARQVLSFLDVRLMNQPEVYLGGAAELFGPEGELTDPKTAEYFRSIADAFAAWVRQHRA